MSVNGLVEALSQLSQHPGGHAKLLHHGSWTNREHQDAAQQLRGAAAGPNQVLLEDGQILLQYLTDVDRSASQPGSAEAGLLPNLTLYAEANPGARGSQDSSPQQLLGLTESYHTMGQMPAAAGANAGGPTAPAEASSSTHQDTLAASSSHLPGGPYIHPSLQLPNSILVTQSTDPMQAAGLINFTFSQSPHSFFVLNTLCGAEQGVSNVAVLNTALQVVLSARKINQHAVARFDLGFVPFVVSDAADGIGLLVYKCNISPEVAKARGQVLKMEPTSNPLVAGLSLFNMLQTSMQQLEVIFTADAAKVALQALAITRINLANNGRDILLLASTIEYAADASGPKNYYLMKITPATPALPCFQHQIDVPKPAPGHFAAGEPAMVGRMHIAKPYAVDQSAVPHTHAVQYIAAPAVQLHGKLGPHAGGPMLGPMLAAPHHHVSPSAGLLAVAGPHAGKSHTMVAVGAGPAAVPYGGAALGMLGPAASAAAAAGPGMGPKQPRARKADYVIVTEDTAIKNAAGAVAKVLGRVSNQGHCCPVYTEKKTDSFTTVISVAVKAIAVARGYVCNEGMGNEVGFQPYLRHLDRRLDMDLILQWLGGSRSRGVGAGGGGGGLGMGMRPGPGGGVLLHGGGGKAPMDGAELLDDEAMHDERCELAFDVFKVPQLAELQDVGNLPVKVTAHSRPHVVSNIISKLVSEREGAVLITAGGKAMHVAMVAVVSARARLLAKGIDVILLPKFVTVDTTSTLGWESVFLRFTIVRWAPAMVPKLLDACLGQDAMGNRYIVGTPLMMS